MKKNISRPRSSALALTLLFVLGSCDSEPDAPPEVVARPIKMFVVGGAGAEVTLQFSGVVAPAQDATLAFEVPGRVTEINVDQGQDVAQGEVLARLDPSDYESERTVAQSKFEEAEGNFQRAAELIERGNVSQARYDELRSLRDVAAANLEKAEKALADTELKAPFGGTVARKLIDNFQNVQAKQEIIVLQDLSSFEIDVNVPESDFARMRPGLTLEERTKRTNPRIAISSIPDLSISANLKAFSTIADPVTRTYEATLAFNGPADVNIFPGMTATVTITEPNDDVGGGDTSQRIPANAVRSDVEAEPFVWVVDIESMTVSRRSVVLGQLVGSDALVSQGLTEGDTIATSGVHQLRDGMPVRRLEKQ